MSYVNEIINVNAFYFTSTFDRLRLFPREVEYKDKRLTFRDGLQYLVRDGQHTVQLFDMEDGQQVYRLRYENNVWTLVGTR